MDQLRLGTGHSLKREASPPGRPAAQAPEQILQTEPGLHGRHAKRLREDDEGAAAEVVLPRRRLDAPGTPPQQAHSGASDSEPPPLEPAPLALRAVAVAPDGPGPHPARLPAAAGPDLRGPQSVPTAAVPADVHDLVCEEPLFKIIADHMPEGASARHVDALAQAFKEWFGSPVAGRTKVNHLRKGLAVTMRSLFRLPPRVHVHVMTALAKALGHSAQVRSEVYAATQCVELRPEKPAACVWGGTYVWDLPRRVEMARLAVNAFGFTDQDMTRHGQIEVLEGAMIALLEQAQASPSAPSKAGSGRTAPNVTLEQLINWVMRGNYPSTLVRAAAQVNQRHPIDVRLFARLVAALVSAGRDDAVTAIDILPSLARELCPPGDQGWPRSFMRVLTQHWQAARGTPDFYLRSALLFPMLQPHETPGQRLHRAVEAANQEPSASDAAQLLFAALDNLKEGREAARDDLLRVLIDQRASENVLVATVLQSAQRWELKPRWPHPPLPPQHCRTLFESLLAHGQRIPRATLQRLGNACAKLLATDADASLMQHVAMRPADDQQMNAWVALSHGYFEELLRLPPSDGRLAGQLSLLVAGQRAAADTKGTSLPPPAGAASVGLGLASRVSAGTTSAVLRPLFKALRDTPPMAAAMLMRDWLTGFTQGGVSQALAQSLADELCIAASFDPPLSALAAISDAAKAALGAELFTQVSATAGAFDAPVAAPAKPDLQPVRDGKTAVAKLTQLLEQVRALAAASQSTGTAELPPPLPEISAVHRRAAELWKLLCAEQRLLASVPLNDQEQRTTGELLQSAAQSLLALIEAAPASASAAAPDAGSQALSAFQTLRIPQTADVWNADAMALAWRIGLHRMPPQQQDRVLSVRVKRLIELAQTQPEGTLVADPILTGLLQVASSTPRRLDTDRAALGQRLTAALRTALAVPPDQRSQVSSKAAVQLIRVIASSAKAVAEDGSGLAPSAFAALGMRFSTQLASDFTHALADALGAPLSERVTEEIAGMISRTQNAHMGRWSTLGLHLALEHPSARVFGQRLGPVLKVAATVAAHERHISTAAAMLGASFAQRRQDAGEAFAEAVRHLPLSEIVKLWHLNWHLSESPAPPLNLSPVVPVWLATTQAPRADALSRAEVFKLALAFAQSHRAVTDEGVRAAFGPAGSTNHEICMEAAAAAHKPASILRSKHLEDPQKLSLLRDLLTLQSGKLPQHYADLQRMIFNAGCSPQLRIAALTMLGHVAATASRRDVDRPSTFSIRPSHYSEIRALVFDLMRQVPAQPVGGAEQDLPALVDEATHLASFYARMRELPPHGGPKASFIDRELAAVRLSGLPTRVTDMMEMTLAHLRPEGAQAPVAVAAAMAATAEAVVPLG